ncbi:radical SAM protein [Bacteroidota bacterium]
MIIKTIKKISDKIGLWYFNSKKEISKRTNPPYYPNHNEIIIDITYSCNLKCIKCARSCRYIPNNDNISLDQIRKFIQESIDKKRKWKKINLEGGEPSLHPQFFEILNLLREYKNKYSQNTIIQLNTNGYGEKVKNILSQVNSNIKIFNSQKTSVHHDDFMSFNLAPIDFNEYQNIDFTIACYHTTFYGIALNKYGYYHCPQSAGIDRVIGKDIGFKKLPDYDEKMKYQIKNLCKYCGFFIDNNREKLRIRKIQTKEYISPTWVNYLENYNEEVANLIEY